MALGVQCLDGCEETEMIGNLICSWHTSERSFQEWLEKNIELPVLHLHRNLIDSALAIYIQWELIWWRAVWITKKRRTRRRTRKRRRWRRRCSILQAHFTRDFYYRINLTNLHTFADIMLYLLKWFDYMISIIRWKEKLRKHFLSTNSYASWIFYVEYSCINDLDVILKDFILHVYRPTKLVIFMIKRPETWGNS